MMREPMKTIVCLILLFVAMTLTSCYKEEFISVEMLKNKALAGDKKSIERLIELFESDDIKVQSDAYKAVLSVKEGAVDVLLAELDSAEGDKWEYIIATLGMIKSKKVVDRLIAALNSGRKRRYVAAFSLGQVHDRRAIKALVDALDDPDAEVKKYAAISIIKNANIDTDLKQVGSGISLKDELINFLNRDDVSDKTYALSAIGELKNKQALEAVLKEVGGKFKEQAIWALGKLRDERAVDTIIKELSHPDWRIRVAAARSLGSINSSKAVIALERNLTDKNVFVREWAARALEDITSEDYKYKDEKGEMIMPTSLYR